MTLVAVTDTSPIIYLAEIDELELLSIPERLVIPEAVRSELEAGGTPEALTALEYETVQADADDIDTSDLDPGESAALAVAAERDGVLLTDDLAARDRATELGIDVHGTIGILALGYARGHLERDEASALMRTLQRETSLFVSDVVVERGIDLLEER